jgi:hypothetical protein
MGRRTRVFAVLLKKEVTYALDPVATGAVNAILCKKAVRIVPTQTDRISRDLVQAWLGQSQQLPIATRMVLGFDVEAQTSGALGTAPGWGPAIKACGFSETIVAVTSVTYALISSLPDSAAVYFNRDGVQYKALGGRGNFKGDVKYGQVPSYSFDFTCLFGGVSDTVVPAQTLAAFITPEPVNVLNTLVFTINAIAQKAYEFSFDLKNVLTYRNIVGDESITLTDRQPDGSFTVEGPFQAGQDFFALAKSGAVVAAQVVHGSVATKKTQFDLKCQLMDPVEVDLNGVVGYQIPFKLIATQGTGNDEFMITLL